MSQQEKSTLLRELPSVDELLTTEPFVSIAASAGHLTAVRIARSSIEELRQGLLGGSHLERAEVVKTLIQLAADSFTRERFARVNPVINATGVVIHTNLGRSVLSEKAIESVARASGYCTLEYDLSAGKRGKRGAGAEALLCELTGAESAAIVNNCAAAAFLVLRVLSRDKEVVISRGELVEIGGDFRVPDVLVESGAILKEVGTTNRTKLADYEKAISDKTGLILRVHPSNYRVIGFTECPDNRELAKLAHDNNIPFVEDAGSGALVDLSKFGLNEPTISASIAGGVDVATFSGDKLLGGVQAGFIVGRQDLVELIRRHPLYRALRSDKLTYSAIEATLLAYARGTHFEEIPTLRMLSLDAETIRLRAKELIKGGHGELQLELLNGESVIGGGAAPDVKPKTWLISVSANGRSAEDIDQFMRSCDVPIIGRIADDNYLLDLRTVSSAEANEISKALRILADQEF